VRIKAGYPTIVAIKGMKAPTVMPTTPATATVIAMIMTVAIIGEIPFINNYCDARRIKIPEVLKYVSAPGAI